MKNNNRILKNTVSLYAMNIAKMVLPLITLPYLTRVLSKDCYGTVSYVKATMQYMQLIIDFGFILSGTKDVVKAREDKNQLSQEVSSIFGAQCLLGGIAGGVLIVLAMFIPILRENFLYTMLSFVPIFLTCFLFSFVFRGLEQMHIITIRFVLTKTISTALTFIFVMSDADVLFIPIIDIISSMVAVGLVWFEIRKREVKFVKPKFANILNKIKDSAVYFASDIATTAFGALNTLLIGIFINASEVADWSICIQMVNAVQSMYSPITTGIYPEMVKSRNINLIKKVLKLVMPVIGFGCIFTLVVAKYALLIIGGKQYVDAAPILRALVPVMFFAFLSILFGWPTLGAIEKSKETSKTTIITAITQILGLLILLAINQFTLINIALLRGMTEMMLFVLRYSYYRKYRNLFVEVDDKTKVKG